MNNNTPSPNETNTESKKFDVGNFYNDTFASLAMTLDKELYSHAVDKLTQLLSEWIADNAPENIRDIFDDLSFANYFLARFALNEELSDSEWTSYLSTYIRLMNDRRELGEQLYL